MPTDRTITLAPEQLETLAAAFQDAHYYRLGDDVRDINDPDLDPDDREQVAAYAALEKVICDEEPAGGLTYSGTDRAVDGDSSDVILASIGPVDADSLARQTALLMSLSRDSHLAGYEDDVADLIGLARLCGHLLYRAYRAQGMDDTAAQAARDAVLEETA